MSEGGFDTGDLSEEFGCSFAEIGDLDVDGVADVLVGDMEGSFCNPCPGGYWLLFLKPDGSVKSKINVRGYDPLLGGVEDLACGAAAIGDVNGDGVPDAIVGVPERGYSVGDPRVPTNFRPHTGAVMVLFLARDGSTIGSAPGTGYVLSAARATSSVLVYGGEELLAKLDAQRVGSIMQPISGSVDTFQSPIPNDASLFGIHVFAQGFVLGGGIELCNALEPVVKH